MRYKPSCAVSGRAAAEMQRLNAGGIVTILSAMMPIFPNQSYDGKQHNVGFEGLGIMADSRK